MEADIDVNMLIRPILKMEADIDANMLIRPILKMLFEKYRR